MSNNEYDQGRLNLPFVGICTFGKFPYLENWDKIDADVAVLGAPFDFGSQFRFFSSIFLNQFIHFFAS